MSNLPRMIMMGDGLYAGINEDDAMEINQPCAVVTLPNEGDFLKINNILESWFAVAPSDEINRWFGLTYASWLTIPRVLLQDMPDEWQAKFVALLEEYENSYPNQPATGTRVQLTDLNNKLIKTPEWILNYRRPDFNMLAELRGETNA